MHLTIGSFHARFNSPAEDPLLGALRTLRRLADVRQLTDILPPASWTVWAVVEAAAEEASLP